MPLKNYAILKGHVTRGVLAPPGNDHYSVRVVDDDLDYRIAINIASNAKNFGTDLFFYLDDDFRHPILDALKDLPLGRKVFKGSTAAERRQSGVCLDFIRMNLFSRNDMKVFPARVNGDHNDLNERIDDLIQPLVGDEDALVYAFGEAWINENKKDKVFGFKPGNGVHDIHMNQGDLTGKHDQEDGVYQDGGLIVYLPAADKYVAYFTKFQSQSWHTDEQTGHAIGGQTGVPAEPGHRGGGSPHHGGGHPVGPGHDPDGRVRIISAMVNPVGPAPEAETVTLLNATGQPIDLKGWELLDKADARTELAGVLPKGGTLQVAVKPPMALSNKGGLITLLNDKGVKVDGVSYTAAQAGVEGAPVVFV